MVLCVVVIPISWWALYGWILCVKMRRCNKCDMLRLSLFSFLFGGAGCWWWSVIVHVSGLICVCVHLCWCMSECNQYLFASVGTKIVSVKKFKAAHDINKDVHNSSFVVSYFCVVWRQFSFELFLLPPSILLHFLLFLRFSCSVYEFRNQKSGPNVYVCSCFDFWISRTEHIEHWIRLMICFFLLHIAHIRWLDFIVFLRDFVDVGLVPEKKISFKSWQVVEKIKKFYYSEPFLVDGFPLKKDMCPIFFGMCYLFFFHWRFMSNVVKLLWKMKLLAKNS